MCKLHTGTRHCTDWILTPSSRQMCPTCDSSSFFPSLSKYALNNGLGDPCELPEKSFGNFFFPIYYTHCKLSGWRQWGRRGERSVEKSNSGTMELLFSNFEDLQLRLRQKGPHILWKEGKRKEHEREEAEWICISMYHISSCWLISSPVFRIIVVVTYYNTWLLSFICRPKTPSLLDWLQLCWCAKKVTVGSCCGPDVMPQRQVLVLGSSELSRKAVTNFDVRLSQFQLGWRSKNGSSSWPVTRYCRFYLDEGWALNVEPEDVNVCVSTPSQDALLPISSIDAVRTSGSMQAGASRIE